MCGIIAAISKRDVVPILLEGLSKLEYRGYDSAGLVVINNNKFLLKKTIKKITDLRDLVKKNNTHGNIGIAHTRWATHGKPSEANAHPLIVNNNIAIVHNGIVENYESLKESIKSKYKIKFNSDTDSEVIAAKIYCYRQQGLDFLDAVIRACKELQGAYSIAVMDINNNQEIIAARFGSPLVIGIGINEYFLASDYLALQNLTQDLIYLKDGDVVKISTDGIAIYDLSKKRVKRNKTTIKTTQEPVNKGQYRHFMQKEIFEQPQAVAATIEGRIVKKHILDAFLGDNKNIISKCKNIQIIACGTSYYAGLIAKYWFEEFAGIHCQVDIASEFRYRNKVILDNSLLITISQSGETADTLAALKNAIDLKDVKNNKYCGFLTICNVPESSLVRLSNLVALTQAGPEIGVASTKAFTSQLTVILMLLAIFNKHNLNFNNNIIKELNNLSKTLEKFLKLSDQIKSIAKKFEHKKSALFLARGLLFPLALEGALKLKELSYIHAEAVPAGELKHGPLALVDDEMPVIVLMANDNLVEKLKSNIQEALSRGGDLIIFADQAIKWKNKQGLNIIELPSIPHWLAPLAYAIPMQLLAYHVAVLKGTDVDQPRNLAKSVTVE
jgi:glutamine---fructose-6-phosphate transaminase (isomerizing)